MPMCDARRILPRAITNVLMHYACVLRAGGGGVRARGWTGGEDGVDSRGVRHVLPGGPLEGEERGSREFDGGDTAAGGGGDCRVWRILLATSSILATSYNALWTRVSYIKH